MNIPRHIRTTRPPTERQLRTLYWLHVTIQDLGYAPTIREVMRGLGYHSTNATEEVLGALQRRGFITREPGRSRTLRLTEDGKGACASRFPHAMTQAMTKPDADGPGPVLAALRRAWELRCGSYDPWPEDGDNPEPHDNTAQHVFDLLYAAAFEAVTGDPC